MRGYWLLPIVRCSAMAAALGPTVDVAVAAEGGNIDRKSSKVEASVSAVAAAVTAPFV